MPLNLLRVHAYGVGLRFQFSQSQNNALWAWEQHVGAVAHCRVGRATLQPSNSLSELASPLAEALIFAPMSARPENQIVAKKQKSPRPAAQPKTSPLPWRTRRLRRPK